MKLTQEQIEDIRKRAEAATTGDWDYDVEDFDVSNGNFMVLQGEVRESNGVTCAAIKAKESDLRFICDAREDIPALLAHIAELERINEIFSKQLESVNKDRHLWRELRLEASGRLMEVVPRMTKYEEALQKIFEGEVDSLGDAFLIAKEALKDAKS